MTPPNQPKGRLQPTRPATLAVAALATTALAWIGISNLWASLPTLPWLPPLTLIGLAIFEAFEAYGTKNRIDRRAGAAPVQPLIVARYAVLAKASALAGALFGGLYLGMSTWLLSQRGVLARVNEDLPQALVGVAGSVMLVAAALWLERACRVPPPPEGDVPRRGDATLAQDDQAA